METDPDLIEAVQSDYRSETLAFAGIAAVLNFYDGTKPPNTTYPDDGTLVASCPMSSPAFSVPVAGVMTANAITPDGDTAAGTVSYWRIKSSTGVCVFQGTAGTGSEEFVFDNNVFALHDTCTVDEFHITITIS